MSKKSTYFLSMTIMLLLIAHALTQTARATSPIPSIVWVRTWGGSGTEFSTCLQRDSLGNLYSAGPTNSFGVGGYDTFILKYDSSGNLLWQKTWGAPNSDDIANPCGLDSAGNLYIAGYTQPTGNDCPAYPGYGSCSVFVLKLDPSGNILWQRQWGGNASNVPHDLVVDSSGNTYVSGYFETSGSGGGIPNAFLLKFSSTGALLWQKSWGGLRGDNGNGLDLDAAGNIYLTGYTKTFGDGSGDLFLLKISSSGNMIWERAWGLNGFDEGFRMRVDGSGNVFVTGRTASFNTGTGGNLLLLKYNSTGSLQWQRIWGPTGSTGVMSVGGEISLDRSGNIFIAGVTGNSSFDPTTWDLLILEFSSQGKLINQNAFGALGNDGSGGLALGEAGALYISGHVSEPPPYNLTTLNYTSVSPVLGSGTPTIPLQNPTYPVTTLNANITTSMGSSTYGGGMDALLFKYTTGAPTPTFPVLLVSLTVPAVIATILWVNRHKRVPP